MARRVDNDQSTIDSRDVIARIRELESDIEVMTDEQATGVELDSIDLSNLEDMRGELEILQALEEEASQSADWPHGETLIRDSYFEDYARQMADDLGLISDDTQWPFTCIDWEEAAEELQADYTSVDFDGVTYWIRWG